MTKPHVVSGVTAPTSSKICKWSKLPPDYDRLLEFQIEELKHEGRYRYFIENSRYAGQFPLTLAKTASGARQITVWCSNDYLGVNGGAIPGHRGGVKVGH